MLPYLANKTLATTYLQELFGLILRVERDPYTTFKQLGITLYNCMSRQDSVNLERFLQVKKFNLPPLIQSGLTTSLNKQ
jgi:hypothetical protein